MKRYFNLLMKIAEEYNIQKGKTENELVWATRIVYSLLSQVGYSSLYDIEDSFRPVSIVHFKDRISKSLEHLLLMYPELQGKFVLGDNTLTDELYSLFLYNGCIYHEPNRIRPCARAVGKGSKCVFMRGQALEEKRWISGSGCYRLLNDIGKLDEKCTPFEDLFFLQKHSLHESWVETVSRAHFEQKIQDIMFEYLRTTPPYRNGYWTSEIDISGGVSIARTTLDGKRLYYLIKQEGNDYYMSQLPEWMTEDYNYRSIAVACLCAKEALPSTEYHIDGPIVNLQINYLFPPTELRFIKLYSWPTSYSDFPHDFRRVMNCDVFEEIKTYLEKIGYRFKEV